MAMKRWLVVFSNGLSMVASSENQAKNYAHCDKKASILRVFEAEEKVWVVRSETGLFQCAYYEKEEAEDNMLPGDTLSEEWLGGAT